MMSMGHLHYLLAVTSEGEVWSSSLRASISVLKDSAILHSSEDRGALGNINLILYHRWDGLHPSRCHGMQGVAVNEAEFRLF